ncbi:glycoside hydrolase family 5 protein [Stemphylium lycopersici]|nr:glycoside hydrolase family 5 protein [Stemphylium lycopersici]
MEEEITKELSNIELEGDSNPEKTPTPRAELEATIQSLVDRGRRLNDEVETYVTAVLEKQKTGKVQNPVEYRNLRNDMRNELAFLNKLAGSEMDEEKARHYIVSSNLLYYEALWNAAKRSSGLQSFRKYFFWDRHKAPAGKQTTKGVSLSKGSQTKNKNKTAALVDIVAEQGNEWIRVSTVSEKRILFDLAKLGWVNDPDSDSDEDMALQNNNDDEDDDEDQIDVVRNSRQLARAARANPIRGHAPKVRFVLTRIEAGRSPPIDTIIAKIRATGAIVECGTAIPPALSIHAVLPRLLIDRSRALSSTLNIDCTILLALISDISHHPCPVLDWYPSEVRAQIDEEAKEHLLPTHLYPAIQAHPMVCTREAADQMNLIVQTLATDTEKLRADILLGQGDHEGRSREELVKEWTDLSSHPTPPGLSLPIAVQSIDLDKLTASLPTVAVTVASELLPLNASIFLFGWAKNLTTLSANRGRARQIETIINEHGLKDGEAGPHIWLCGTFKMQLLKFLLPLAMSAPFSTAQPLDDRAISSSWAGVNSYFLHAYQKADRLAVLDAVKDAKLKTLRIFISHTFQNNKDTGSVNMPDIEPQQVGTYDDTQLRAIDQLMVEAHDRDTYVSKYKLPAIDCAKRPASQNDVTFFYQDASPIFDFDNRLTHILQHKNQLLPGAPQWKDLSDYIFAFNIQNEGQGHLRNNIAPAPGWWCDRSKKMRSIMGNSAILISTGGGNEFPNSDIPQNWACPTLDLIDIHSYSGVSEWRNKAPLALQHALAANKLVLFEEFGALGDNKAAVVGQHIDVFNGLKVPWMIWQINKPGKGKADYEFWVDEETFGVVKTGAAKALSITAAQRFPNLV